MSTGAHEAVLITGGAGFIGTNVADHLIAAGWPVILYDNLSREGVARNLAWLRERHGERFEIELADVRDTTRLRGAVARAAHVFHFAAQVAAPKSRRGLRGQCTRDAQRPRGRPGRTGAAGAGLHLDEQGVRSAG
jgi:nucleoside-diphosphate-sugar epimerase